jgi:hypothetical protein
LLNGNALLTDQGTILCVGQGVLLVNGVPLTGDSLIASRKAQVALYDAPTMTYDVQDVGFTTVPNITGANITILAGGGTKNMSLGYYSFHVVYYSTKTAGFGDPTDTLLDPVTHEGFKITAVNSRFDIDFSSDVPPPKANGYIIYGNPYSGSSDNSRVSAIQGPWFAIGDPVPFTDLIGGHYTFDYVDFDLDANSPVAFNNDPPPDAEFYGELDRYPFLISTNGPGVGSGSRSVSTSPGAFVSPIKAENFDAYPFTFKVPTEKGETIIGVVSAAGRIFVMTANTLQAVTPTGLPSAPFTCRPFWKRGFQGQFSLCFVDDTLYGFTSAGVFRSIATGDEGNESHEFAASVEAQMAGWNGAYVFVRHDPKNEEICFIYSAAQQNDDGYWESLIYPYSLRFNDWQIPIVLTSETQDMVVSGAATVHGHLELIVGGRTAGPSSWKTYRYDSPGGEIVPAYVTFTYQDGGAEMTAKCIRKMRPKGKFTSAKMQIYATTPDSDVDVTDLETGANPAFEVSLTDSTVVKQYEITKTRVRNAMMWTARLELSADTSDDVLDQIHELAIELDSYGQLR